MLMAFPVNVASVCVSILTWSHILAFLLWCGLRVFSIWLFCPSDHPVVSSPIAFQGTDRLAGRCHPPRCSRTALFIVPRIVRQARYRYYVLAPFSVGGSAVTGPLLWMAGAAVPTGAPDTGTQDFGNHYGQFGLPLHHPRFLELMGAPESVRLLSRDPNTWINMSYVSRGRQQY